MSFLIWQVVNITGIYRASRLFDVLWHGQEPVTRAHSTVVESIQALRVVRCHFVTGKYTSKTIRHENHYHKMIDISINIR